MSIDLPDAVRHAGPKAAVVLEELADRRAATLTVSSDKEWLRAITPHYPRLLSRMEDQQLLYRIKRGHYVVAPRGSFSPAQAVPAELAAGRFLAAHGDYFVSHLSALIAHRLTDLHGDEIYAAIPASSSYKGGAIDLGDLGRVHVTRLQPSRWPSEAHRAQEIEEVRAVAESMEIIQRATIERALVDALARPDLAAGFETVVSCWIRAREADVDWTTICEIAARQGAAMIRRTAYLMRLLGLEPVAAEAFGAVPSRGARTPLDRSNGFELPAEDLVRDARTGVVLNVPPDYLQAWTGATSAT